jgi:ABC-type multidrug transport system fused ATPase/permease subunit
MSAGKIVEEGSHPELLRANGHYARLYNLAVSSDLDTSQEEVLE